MAAEPEEIVEEVFENQRYIPLEGFSGKYLLPGERPQWSDSRGAPVAVCCRALARIPLAMKRIAAVVNSCMVPVVQDQVSLFTALANQRA